MHAHQQGSPSAFLVKKGTNRSLFLSSSGQKGMRCPHSTESQGWTPVSPPPPSPRPTLERHVSSRQNKRPLIAGALCLLSEMNPTLYKLGFNSAGRAVSPHHIPFILRAPTRTPGPALLGFLLCAHQRQLAAAWGGRQARCPGAQPAGRALASADESPRDRRQPFSENWVS